MTSSTEYAVRLSDVEIARRRIDGLIHRTPVMHSRLFDERAGRSVFFKCENLQRVGAFKMRGAANAVMALDDAAAAKGVLTHSSGNHAQALALAARERGIAAHIVMPENAPAVKRRAVEAYGARVYPCAPTLCARETTARDVQTQTGAAFIHPYDRAEIIAGQGTCVMELLEEVPDLDAVIAPVGGGGLLSGTAIASRALRAATRVFGAEPAGADDAARSLAAGRLIPQEDPRTIADGLLTSLGILTWPIVRDHVEAILTVPDEATIAAMRLVMGRLKIVIEPSAAVAVAAVLDDAFPPPGQIARVGVVLSGGNVDLDHLPW
ncbi:MAG: pyridoxal-phosphate dependent enzyme [Phycisphaerales bacterium]|nr:pyridoxal-phosphate dependent enzyme [Phycisphaerae bacterium]NNF44614.1 pyridoxal-phosphate dependent enzyme [Phycisphaerales bacterium]NNM25359.1 pyridoxal-phosphate dependent enzyme [Phycisphaerales bacterium]